MSLHLGYGQQDLRKYYCHHIQIKPESLDHDFFSILLQKFNFDLCNAVLPGPSNTNFSLFTKPSSILSWNQGKSWALAPLEFAVSERSWPVPIKYIETPPMLSPPISNKAKLNVIISKPTTIGLSCALCWYKSTLNSDPVSFKTYNQGVPRK